MLRSSKHCHCAGNTQVSGHARGGMEVWVFLRPQEVLLKSDGELYTLASALADQYKDDLSADFPEQVLSFRRTFVSKT